MEDQEKEEEALVVSDSDTIFEEREELMLSGISTSETPTLRTAHFLKPCLVSKEPSDVHYEQKTLFFSHKNDCLSQTKPPLEVKFMGWRYPVRGWKNWVQRLHSEHQSVWKKAGIYEAIMGSVYEVKRDKDFVLKLAEKWCPETNTFVFRWGEATVTLEDMAVLGGFSVSGQSVWGKSCEKEVAEAVKELVGACKEASVAAIKPGNNWSRPNGIVWMRHFMGTGKRLEHEAFLSLWLLIHVFPTERYYFSYHVFPLAVRLARGTRIAIAPAVLCAIYRDLRVLKETLVAASSLAEGKRRMFLTLTAPFQFVLVWAWERFSALSSKLRPFSDSVSGTRLRLARWEGWNSNGIVDRMLVLDSAGESFLWRPYSIHELGPEKERWVSVGEGFDAELEALARCLRPSELVGMDYVIEPYLPHRVARQFGLDQDVPCLVAHHNSSPIVAWINYIRPIRNEKLYIPVTNFKSGVTIRYAKWWKCAVLDPGDSIKSHSRRARNTRRSPRTIGAWNVEVSLTRFARKGRFLNLNTMEVEKFSVRGQEVTMKSVTEQEKKAPEAELRAKEIDEGSEPEIEEVSPIDCAREDCPVVPLSAPQHQNISPSSEASVAGPATTTSKNALHGEREANEVRGAVTSGQDSFVVIVDPKEMASENVVIAIEDDEEATNYKFRGGAVPDLELEARVSRLERVLSDLKRRRYAHLFEDQTAKKSRI